MTLRAWRCVIAALFATVTLLAMARSTQARLRPARAQADVQAARKEGSFTFCSAPHEPLSPQARALCPPAREIPDCGGFASACARLEVPPSPSRWGWLRWLALGGVVARAIVWGLVAAVALAVIVPVALALARMRRDRTFADEPLAAFPSAAAPEADALSDDADLFGRAQAHAARGEHSIALQLYLAASLHALDKRGALRVARDRTNGEYVRMCKDAAASRELRAIVREVDRVQFGREAPTPEAVARAASGAQTIVRGLPLVIAVLAAATLLGCGGLDRAKAWAGRSGDDPAGDELLQEMLRRQGTPAKPLAASLASLPLPQPGQPSAGVMVDVERVALDEDTRAHLVDWVDAGGVLVLVGSPDGWPPEFRVAVATTGASRDLLAIGPVERRAERGALTGPSALRFDGESRRVAWFGDDRTYAALLAHGKGSVLGIASDELFTNVGLSRPDNAAVATLILSNADCSELRIAHPEDGFSQPSSPIAALTRAGLGLGLIHALLAATVLFAAVGVRMMRAQPALPPHRRAFAEHVYAVGALYARTRSAPHALAVYTRFADERLRARMPRGSNDVVAFLASRAHQPIDVCRRIWERATGTKVDQPPVGDELTLLRELSAIYEAATAQDR